MTLFITFEGGEGTGKTTQVELLVDRLRQTGQKVLALREPGGTPLGDYLRTWLKAGDRPLTPETELLLFASARSELVRTVIKPALASGTHVVLDRYADSTTVYQGYGRGLPMVQVRAANYLASAGLMPDITFLLDAPLKLALSRAKNRAENEGQRFEDETLAFHRRIKAGFRRLARRSPDRWATINAAEKVDLMHETIWGRVQVMLTT